MLVRDEPSTILLAQNDREPQAIVRVTRVVGQDDTEVPRVDRARPALDECSDLGFIVHE